MDTVPRPRLGPSLYLENFDKFLSQNDSIVFFARYVDDIVIIATKDISEIVISELKSDKFNLEINPKKIYKTHILESSSASDTFNEFDYLGYKFKIHAPCEEKNKERKIDIAISNKKVKRIKTKMSKAVVLYLREKNFNNFYLRMKLLTSNFSLNSTKNGSLLTGIFFNYQVINDDNCLNDLNLYKTRILNGKSRIGRELQVKLPLTQNQKDKLNKLNFYSGFHLKLKVSFTKKKIITLHRCWKYV